MQLDLRSAPGGKDFSSQVASSAPGPKGGRRASAARASIIGQGGGESGASGGGGGDLPPPPIKAPHDMTAAERVEFELSREADVLLTTCTACGITVPKEK